MSHELRTRLTACYSCAAAPMKMGGESQRQSKIRYAKTFTMRAILIQLINDILDLSKNRIRFITAKFLLFAFSEIAGFVETRSNRFRSADLRFTIETDAKLPISMERICRSQPDSEKSFVELI